MTRIHPYRRRGLTLLLIMALVAALATAVVLYAVYQTAMQQQRDRLMESAAGWASLIDAVARFDSKHSADDVPGGSPAATLAQIRSAHARFRGYGRSGELVLARRDRDRIVFLLGHRHAVTPPLPSVPFADAGTAQPMRAALLGHSGVMVGTDYRGIAVVAAYEPLPALQSGLVAKIDLAEVRRPFLHVGLWAATIGIALILFGVFFILRLGSPLVQRLEESESDLRIWENAFAFTADGMLIVDARQTDKPIVSVNPAFERITGYQADDLVGRGYRFLDPGDEQPQAAQTLHLAIRHGRNCRLVLHNRRKDGSPYWSQLSVSPVKHGSGRVTHFLITLQDITERKHLEDRLKELATHDALTGLLNRAEIERLAAQEIGRSKRYNHSMGLLLIDIDHFKRINDTWGHPTGDLVLQRFAHALRETIRQHDQAGRYGGEEFLVMMPESSREQAVQMAERLCQSIRELPTEIGTADRIDISVSIGVAVFPDDGKTRDRLIGQADRALYTAKQTGRDRVVSAAGLDS